MWPCLRLIALAHTSATPASTSASTVRTLASTSVPIATTARSNWPTPSWRSASSSVLSACTTWVRVCDHFSTSSPSSSIASTSWPIRTSDCATAIPKRPSPMTTTDVWLLVRTFLANNGSLLGQVVVVVPGLERQRRRHRDGAHSSDVHQDDERRLGADRHLGDDTGRQPDGRERRDRLEQRDVEAEVGHQQDRHRPDRDDRDAEQRDGERLAERRAPDPAVGDVRVALAADLRPDDEGQQEERRHL